MTLGALGQVLIQMRKNDLLGLAGQLAYFFLLSFFPFLIFLVSLVGSVVQAPQAEVEGLIQRTSGFIPADAVTLLVDYVDRTLRNAASSSLFFGILGTLFLGSMASVAIIQAANRAYELRETRPFWKVRGISILLALGFTLLVTALTLVVVQVEDYAGGPEGLPGAPILWGVVRWTLAFFTVILALDVLYYLAPDARLPFKWITPGGVSAAALMFAASASFSFYVSRLGSYDQVYGQVAALIVLLLWLYVTGLTLLLGIELNAVVARRVERERNYEVVGPSSAEDKAPRR